MRGLVLTPTNKYATVVRLVRCEEGDGERATRRRAGRVEGEFSLQRGTSYAMTRFFPHSPSGFPCTPPPWSTLAAVELSTGEVRWQVPLGVWPGHEEDPQAQQWGSISLGRTCVRQPGDCGIHSRSRAV